MGAVRLGRNDTCPCGSGRKYKVCCLRQRAHTLNGGVGVHSVSPGQAALTESVVTAPRAAGSATLPNKGSQKLVTITVANEQATVLAEELEFLRKVRTWSSDRLARADIAELNMACAIKLPGSEDLCIPLLMKTLDEWASVIGQITDRHYGQFRDDPAAYGQSEPYWRMLILTTVLQQRFGVKYNREKIEHMDWSDTRDLFVHGLLGPRRSGTCPSLPVLIIAVGRRLGYPLRLVLSPGHAFSRWDDPQAGVWLNIECHGNGLVTYPDERYHHYLVEWTPELHAEEKRLGPNRIFLRSLSPAEELAFFLAQRGHVWETLERWPEATAVYNLAADLMPYHRGYANYAGETWRKMVDPSYQLSEHPKWKGVAVNYSAQATC